MLEIGKKSILFEKFNNDFIGKSNSGFGFFISLISFIYIIITLVQTFIFGIVVPGYVTTLSAVLFLGGIIEFSVGVLGEYVGHIYIETKQRPLYITRLTNIQDECDDLKGNK